MEPSQTPFDEKSALEELERLRDAIQAARRARMAKSDEFDEFVKGFKQPPAPEPQPDSEPEPEPVSLMPDLPTPSPLAELLTLTPAPEQPLTLPPTPEPPPPTAEIPETPPQIVVPASVPAISVADIAAQPTPVSPRRYPAGRFIGIFAVAALALIAILMYWSRGPSTRVVEAPANTVQTPAPAVQEPPVTAPPPAPPSPVANVTVELRTLQPVWMRVTVDGQKQREGTVPAGELLQLHADRAIVVRAGNGADVVVKTANGETPLGVAGQPITFTFTKAGGKS
jgi:hypothetical protein